MGLTFLDLTYAYDASIEGNQGVTVDLGFGTVELNDGTEISILNSEFESFSGTHQDDHFYGASSDAYSTLNKIQSFAPGMGADFVSGYADPGVLTR